MSKSNTRDITSPALRRDLDKLGKEIGNMLNADFTERTKPTKREVAQKWWKNRIVCYDHKRRQCFDETGNQSAPITTEEAREAYESGTLSDFNLALRQLAIQDWDMEMVEEYYREQDALRK